MMKMKTTLTIAFLTIVVSLSAQLNTNAENIREKLPVYYEQIRCFAINEWGTDHKMVVYTINQQSDSFWEYAAVTQSVKPGDPGYAEIIQAMAQWEVPECDGYDYRMVMYTYDSQMENTDY